MPLRPLCTILDNHCPEQVCYKFSFVAYYHSVSVVNCGNKIVVTIRDPSGRQLEAYLVVDFDYLVVPRF